MFMGFIKYAHLVGYFQHAHKSTFVISEQR